MEAQMNSAFASQPTAFAAVQLSSGPGAVFPSTIPIGAALQSRPRRLKKGPIMYQQRKFCSRAAWTLRGPMCRK